MIGVYYSRNFIEILKELDITIMISSFQANKVVTINSNYLDAKTIRHPTGILVHKDKIYIGCERNIYIFKKRKEFISFVKPIIYEYHKNIYTGLIDIHEIEWINEKIWYVNTRFDCICSYDESLEKIEVEWIPNCIENFIAEDCLHLNGLSKKKDNIYYVTALGRSNTYRGWKRNILNGGIIINTYTKDIIYEGLAAPHSPYIYQEDLYFCESTKGNLLKMNLKTKVLQKQMNFHGFIRGLDFFNEYIFVGVSSFRYDYFQGKFPKTLQNKFCGVYIVNIADNKIVSYMKFHDEIHEIFDIKILNGVCQIS